MMLLKLKIVSSQSAAMVAIRQQGREVGGTHPIGGCGCAQVSPYLLLWSGIMHTEATFHCDTVPWPRP